MGNLESLQRLDLSSNELAFLPPEIGNLEGLQWLDLKFNKLASLPSQIGNLKRLLSLYLYYNELTSLPSEIGILKNLAWLTLSSNKLISLPSEIRNLRRLIFLDLRGNLGLVERGEGHTLGWRELLDAFDVNMLLNENAIQAPPALIEEKYLYARLDNLPLHWDRTKLKAIKPIISIGTQWSSAKMMNKWNKLQHLYNGNDELRIKFSHATGNVKYIWDIELNDEEKKLWKVYSENKPHARLLLQGIVELMKTRDEDTQKTILFQLVNGLIECPDGQMSALSYLYVSLTQSDAPFECDKDDFKEQLRQTLALEKHILFELAVLPGQGDQNVHVFTHWQHELNEELGLNMPHVPRMGTMGQDPFRGRKGNVLAAFYAKFTPGHAITYLEKWIHQNEKRIWACAAWLVSEQRLDQNDSDAMDRYFTMDTDSNGFQKLVGVKTKLAQYILVDVLGWIISAETSDSTEACSV